MASTKSAAVVAKTTLLAVDDVEAFGRQRVRHDRPGHRQRVQHLQLGAAAVPNRAHVDAGAFEIRTDVVDEAIDAQGRIRGRGVAEPGRRIAADDAHCRVRDPRLERRPHLVDEEAHRVDVRVPVHGADEHEGVRDRRRRPRSEVRDVDAVRHRDDARMRCDRAQAIAVDVGARDVDVEPRNDVPLVAEQAFPFAVIQPPLDRHRLVLGPPQQHVRLDVVVTEAGRQAGHDRAVLRERHGIEVHEVVALRGSGRDQRVAHARAAQPADRGIAAQQAGERQARAPGHLRLRRDRQEVADGAERRERGQRVTQRAGAILAGEAAIEPRGLDEAGHVDVGMAGQLAHEMVAAQQHARHRRIRHQVRHPEHAQAVGHGHGGANRGARSSGRRPTPCGRRR